MLQVTFAEVTHLLASLGSMLPAAEGHGCLCGALCISHQYTFERWRDELLPEDRMQPAATDEEVLRLLFSDTLGALDQDADFQPLLPDDDVVLEQRTSALAQWASGFLYGFGTAQPGAAAQLPQNVEEILRDFARIGAANVEVDADEEQEHAYAELVEYLRVGVWLVYAELTELRTRPSK